MGQGITPSRYHPTADAMSEEGLGRFLEDIRSSVLSTAGRLPPHMDYMRSYAPAGKP